MIRPALAVLALVLLGACQRGGEAPPPASSQIPPGMCLCPCAASGVGAQAAVPPAGSAPGGTATAEAGPDLGDLLASASRKMNHADGVGCLADLDAAARLDAKAAARLGMVRGQCEMLAGQCQQGKARLVQSYVEDSGMSRAFAERTVDALAGMRCRGGDSTPRDQLLGALWALSDAAYVNPRTSAECQQHLDVARRLLPVVPPRDAEDTQVSGGGQALYYTAARCFARADDCRAAFAAFRDNFPAASLSQIADPGQREKVVRDAFTTTIERCASAPLP